MGSTQMETIMKIFTNLPEPLQERAQEIMMRSLQNPYYLANLSIPIAFGLAYIPHFVKVTLAILNKGINYNNETPRTEKYSEYAAFGGMITRAAAAHLNALELFPAFAAGVLLARSEKVKPSVLTPLCMRYLALRLLYTFLYIFGVNKVIAAMRTLSWASMVNTIVSIYSEAL